MKKYIFTLVLLLVFLTPSTLNAQSQTYTDAFLQYNLKTEEYNKAHETYVIKRSAYLKFKSLQSEREARDATVVMLQARDDVLVTYLTAIKRRMEETEGMTPEELSTNQKLLDGEIAFFADHKAKIPSAGTLKDLENDSKLAANRNDTNTRTFYYKMLFSISNGKISDLKTRLTENLSRVKTKVNTIRQETRPEYQFDANKISSLDRNVFDSENKMTRATEKQASANDLKNLRDYTQQTYTQKLNILAETQQLLKEASSFLRETLSQIKSK